MRGAVTSRRQLPHSWWRPWVLRKAEDPGRGSLPPLLFLGDLWPPRVGSRSLWLWAQGQSRGSHQGSPLPPPLPHLTLWLLGSLAVVRDPSRQSATHVAQGPSRWAGVQGSSSGRLVGQVVCRRGNLVWLEKESWGAPQVSSAPQRFGLTREGQKWGMRAAWE